LIPFHIGIFRFVPKGDESKVLLGEPVDASVDVGAAMRKGEEVELRLYSGSSVLGAGPVGGGGWGSAKGADQISNLWRRLVRSFWLALSDRSDLDDVPGFVADNKAVLFEHPSYNPGAWGMEVSWAGR